MPESPEPKHGEARGGGEGSLVDRMSKGGMRQMGVGFDHDGLHLSCLNVQGTLMLGEG